MSTRALTIVYDEQDRSIATIYCHSDGYPEGHGLDLAKILKDRTVVNGIEIPEQKNASNGMGCLAATIVAELKDGIGGIYLRSDPEMDYGQEFEYHIQNKNVLVIDVYGDNTIFHGTWNEFWDFCQEPQE